MLLAPIRRHAAKYLLLSSHNVRQHARFDARQQPPQPVADVLSPTEAKLHERLGHQVDALKYQRERALKSERVNAIANDLAADERSFEDLVRDTKKEIWVARLKFNPAWVAARRLILQRLEELDQFKREHLLKRAANYHSLVLAIGVLMLACVGETLVNATLFAQVSKWGYTGGALYSLALSLPNLGLGFAAGFWGLRGRNHIRPPVRWLATVILIATVSAGALWNFYVGHLRALAERHAESRRPLLLTQWHEVIDQINADPAAVLASPQAIILIAAGVVVFIIALHDGLSGVADRYPGYAQVDRRLHSAIAAAHALKWKFFTRLTNLTQHGIDLIDTRAGVIEGKCRQGLRILDGARTIMNRYDQRTADQLWIHRAVVREYQSLNRRLRDEQDIPPRFDQPLRPDLALPEYDWRGMRDKIRATAVAAHQAADHATVILGDHRLSTMQEIDREGFDLSAVPCAASTASFPT